MPEVKESRGSVPAAPNQSVKEPVPSLELVLPRPDKRISGAPSGDAQCPRAFRGGGGGGISCRQEDKERKKRKKKKKKEEEREQRATEQATIPPVLLLPPPRDTCR
ncbi:unnamed protein product [Pleuronectes platessa]|uniref:Uncharacterized protein n=1 Tax=Pleuronectes platessa TaxID=8262 RepID=A0A9N7Z824_PLEPL|nr:unnamed protein product [Pleuronectes platessa]